MSKNSIIVTVKLFAIYQEVCGQPEIELQLPKNSTVNTVLDTIVAQQPTLAKWRELTRFGIDYQFVPPDTILQTGNEVVLIPPVSGG
jgi:molybdopterin synthase sulfur carrier subunit